MWPAAPSSGSTRGGINYGIPHDFGMVGVRDVFLVAPASSFLQPQQPDQGLLSSSDPNSGGYYLKKPLVIDYNNSNSNNNNNNNTFITATAGGGGGANSSGSATCQDCGNQAKRDCSHRRCRTCCKSRGYDCNTHLKSTWVPAARRRERQLMVGGGGTGTSSASTSGGGSKKPRLVTSQQTTTTSHTSNSNNTPPRSFETSSSHQDASFKEKMPGQVRAPAVFKCVRVTSMDDGDDEYAYQAMVNIGGHIFKGFLYDQGEETKYPNEFPNMSELHLGGASGKNAGTSSSPMLDDVYGATTGGGGLLGSANFDMANATYDCNIFMARLAVNFLRRYVRVSRKQNAYPA